MNKMRCIIVDDEPVARKILEEFIRQTGFLECVGQFENTIKTGDFLKDNTADIMFLDIEMPRSNGLQYLKKAVAGPLVILTTAYPEYALEGYELDIIDYLLKPIAFKRFLKAVEKAREYARLKAANAPSSPAYLFVRSEKRIEKVELQDILYIESAGNYVFIYTGTKKIMAYLTLKGIESQLPPADFVKVHQSFLVCFSKIDAIEGNTIKMKGKTVPISRNYRDAVMELVSQRLLKR
ncbi:MAG: response regulator transcription factor [Chitinophagaceae bacterium]|nr:response regulator transcription factor [Chitinophagaceae bacterium]